MSFIAKQHAGYGLLIQTLVGAVSYAFGVLTGIVPAVTLITVSAWIGMAAATSFFVSREYSQSEARQGIVGHAKPWEGFMGWDAKSYSDAITPFVVCSAVATAITVLV